MTGIPATPGFWPDYYVCFEYNLVETINRMLQEHASDFPITACGGFTIEKFGTMYKLFPIVMRTINDTKIK